MEYITAKSAGFCFGVKRAMEKVAEQIDARDENIKIYTYGPIIHNEEVVKNLEEKGVHAIRSDEELKSIVEENLSGNDAKKCRIIIRSHGVSKAVGEMLENSGFEVIDATCPFVKRIHNTVLKESEEGREIIIAGNPNHPEVEGIMGWCKNKPIVVESAEDLDKYSFSKEKKYAVVAQTTFNHKKFQDIVEKISNICYDNASVVDTICNATYDRQKESREIASKVDIMIVIGDTHSSNSKKLYEICKDECEDTHFIQTLDDLNLENAKSVRLVGITAGASTPDYIIEEVQNYVGNDF